MRTQTNDTHKQIMAKFTHATFQLYEIAYFNDQRVLNVVIKSNLKIVDCLICEYIFYVEYDLPL